MPIATPYHEGELQVQRRSGESAIAERTGRVISNTIIPGALKFIGQLPMAVLGSMDEDDNLWASILLGRPGFMTADPQTVAFDLAQTESLLHDPLWSNIERTPRVGALMIELASRRRLRVNGRVSRVGHAHLRLEVEEAYPNCPKYIQRRHLAAPTTPWTAAPAGRAHDRAVPRHGRELEPEQRSFLQAADTFFVSSAHPQRGIDASHRGGNPGFVQVLDATTLRIPDYSGNSMFNTLGNFAVFPHAGLVFPDFEHGRSLQLIGRPEIRWELKDTDDRTGGTRRSWDLHIDGWLQSDHAQPRRWEFLDASPHNP